MSKKFIVERIEVEEHFNSHSKMPFKIYKPISKDGKLFADYIKEVPDGKFYILYDSNTHRVLASSFHDITTLPVLTEPDLNLVFTWIDVPESKSIIPFNRKNEVIKLDSIANHSAGNIFISNSTDDFFHLNRFEYLNEFDQIILDINLLKKDISYTIDSSIDKAEYIGFKFTYKNNDYLQPYRSEDINNLKILIDLPAFTNEDVKLYIASDIYKRDSSNYVTCSMTDDELKDLLARMFKCNMDRKVIKRKIEEYLDTFTDGKELFKSIGCRINEHNTPETDLHKYILDTMINI